MWHTRWREKRAARGTVPGERARWSSLSVIRLKTSDVHPVETTHSVSQKKIRDPQLTRSAFKGSRDRTLVCARPTRSTGPDEEYESTISQRERDPVHILWKIGSSETHDLVLFEKGPFFKTERPLFAADAAAAAAAAVALKGETDAGLARVCWCLVWGRWRTRRSAAHLSGRLPPVAVPCECWSLS